jgi:hypothetical protein
MIGRSEVRARRMMADARERMGAIAGAASRQAMLREQEQCQEGRSTLGTWKRTADLAGTARMAASIFSMSTVWVSSSR